MSDSKTMRETEIRKRAVCSLCRELIGKAGPMFWTIQAAQWVIDLAAARRQTGLALALGSAELALAMGPDDPMARALHECDLTICGNCLMRIGELAPALCGEKEAERA